MLCSTLAGVDQDMQATSLAGHKLVVRPLSREQLNGSVCYT
jgi:hypothetical protein